MASSCFSLRLIKVTPISSGPKGELACDPCGGPTLIRPVQTAPVRGLILSSLSAESPVVFPFVLLYTTVFLKRVESPPSHPNKIRTSALSPSFKIDPQKTPANTVQRWPPSLNGHADSAQEF